MAKEKSFLVLHFDANSIAYYFTEEEKQLFTKTTRLNQWGGLDIVYEYKNR